MGKMQSIKEVSERFHVSARALRYYEEIGILKSCRINSKYREYDEEQIKRLEIILILRRLSFGIKDIAGLFSSDGAGFSDLLEKRITENNKDYLEIREVSQLLKSFKAELSSRPFSQLNISEILKDYIYITKQTERAIHMIPPYEEKTRVAMGVDIVYDLINEDIGNIVNKVKQLRLELEKDSIQLPKIRMYDSADIEGSQVLIVIDGAEVMRKNYAKENIIECSNEIITEIRKSFAQI